jgi:hypothetical protein
MSTLSALSWKWFVEADSRAPLMFEWRGAVKFLPLLLSGGFFAFSTFWLAVGPLDWHIPNLPLLYAFLGACLLALAGGYTFGALRSHPRRFTVRVAPVVNPNRILIISGLVALVLYFPTVYATTGLWFPDVWGGLTHAANAYHSTKSLNVSSSPIIFYVRFLLSPLLILMAPLTYFLWPRLSRMARLLGLASIAGTVALSIAQGINKGMADLTAYTCLFLALLAVSSLRKGRRRRLVGALVGTGLVIALFLSYYAVNIQSRIASDAQQAATSSAQTQNPAPSGSASDTPAPAPSPTGSPSPKASDADVAKMLNAEVALGGAATPRRGHFVYSLPGGLRTSVLVLSSYITHPYRGLSMALAEDWTPTYGLGFSEFFRHNVSKALGGQAFEDQVTSHTYAGKISAKGWPVGKVWATFFIEPASDISFPGVILLMAVIGFLFATSWRETVTRGDPLAASTFYSLCALVFYLPANNQLFQGGETAVGFSIIFIAWLVVRSGLGNRALKKLGLDSFGPDDYAMVPRGALQGGMAK